MNANYLIKKLDLKKHPEGGYFREIYSAPETIKEDALPDRYSGDRPFGTSIYFLLRSGDVSHFHKLKSDEIWHFYAGSALTLHIIDQSGEYTTVVLGDTPESHEKFQTVVTAGVWFGATVNESDSCSLVGCTVAPGFNFDDFELGDRDELLKLYPQHQKIIEALAVSDNLR